MTTRIRRIREYVNPKAPVGLYFAHLDNGKFTWLHSELSGGRFAVGSFAEVLVRGLDLASIASGSEWIARAELVCANGVGNEVNRYTFEYEGSLESVDPQGTILKLKLIHSTSQNCRYQGLKGHMVNAFWNKWHAVDNMHFDWLSKHMRSSFLTE